MEKLTALELMALLTWDPGELPEPVKSAIHKLLVNYEKQRNLEDVTEGFARSI